MVASLAGCASLKSGRQEACPKLPPRSFINCPSAASARLLSSMWIFLSNFVRHFPYSPPSLSTTDEAFKSDLQNYQSGLFLSLERGAPLQHGRRVAFARLLQAPLWKPLSLGALPAVVGSRRHRRIAGIPTPLGSLPAVYSPWVTPGSPLRAVLLVRLQVQDRAATPTQTNKA